MKEFRGEKGISQEALADAVGRNADYFTWNTASNINNRWGTQGKLFDMIYDKITPKMKLWRQLGVKPEQMQTDNGRTVWGVKLTPELKDRLIREGIPYYTIGGMAVLGSQYGEDEDGMLFPGAPDL